MGSLQDETLAFMQEIGLRQKGDHVPKQQTSKQQRKAKQTTSSAKPSRPPAERNDQKQSNKNTNRKRKLVKDDRPTTNAPSTKLNVAKPTSHIKFADGEPVTSPSFPWAAPGINFPVLEGSAQSGKWYAMLTDLPETPARGRKSQRPLSYDQVELMRDAAEALWEQEVSAHTTQAQQTRSSDQKWVHDVIKTGTLSDKIAALTLLIQQSPFQHCDKLDNLMSMATKKERRTAQLAMRAVKDLFINDLLPDRRLLRFDQRPLNHPDMSTEHVLLYIFEDYLKTKYGELIKALDEGMKDSVEQFKRFCLDVCFDLLLAKPEKEDVLLRMLVNKLGDPSKKITGRALELLVKLTRKHSAMVGTVIDEVQIFLQRPHLAQRATFNAVIFLNSLRFSKTAQSSNAAEKLIGIYFTLFEQSINEKQSQHTAATLAETQAGKIIAALLTGVNRAFPILKSPSKAFKEKLETLFRIVHMSSFSTSVQALGLLFQLVHVADQESDEDSAIRNRFYRALYSALLSDEFVSRSRNTVFLNLVYRAVKYDNEPSRVLAFCKRIIEMSLQCPPPIAAGCIRLLGVAIEAQPDVRAKIIAPQQPAELANKTTENNEGDDAKGHDDSELLYDPLKREPLFAVQGNPGAWEGVLMRQHFHPSVSKMAESFYSSESIGYDGDPTEDFSLKNFLNRFTYKNPKQSHVQRTKRTTEQQQQPMNSLSFLQQHAQEVSPDTMFFHKYFHDRHKLEEAGLTRRKKKQVAKGDGEFGDGGEEAAMDEFADQLAEGLMHDTAVGSGLHIDEDDDDVDYNYGDDFGQVDEVGAADDDEGISDNEKIDDGDMPEEPNEEEDDWDDAQGVINEGDDDEYGEDDGSEDNAPTKQKTSSKPDKKGKQQLNVFASADDYEDLAQEIYDKVAADEDEGGNTEDVAIPQQKLNKRKKPAKQSKKSKLRRT